LPVLLADSHEEEVMGRKKKIVVFAQEAGGANIVASVSKELIAENAGEYHLELIAHLHAVSIFREYDLPFRELVSFGYPLPLSEQDAIKILSLMKCDCFFGGFGNVLLDTSNASMFIAARMLAIRSIAAFDCWQGWGRFHRGSDKFAYAPDILVVIDEHSRKRMMQEGMPEERIEVGGHPVLDRLVAQSVKPYETENSARKQLRDKHGITDHEYLIVLTSQMVNHRTEQNKMREPFIKIATSKGEVMERIWSSLHNVLDLIQDEKSIVLMLRPHPKERMVNELSLSSESIRTSLDRETPKSELFQMADCIMGYDTMMLAEAACAGCFVISFRYSEIDYLDERNTIELCGCGIAVAESDRDLIDMIATDILNNKADITRNGRISSNRILKSSYSQILRRELSSGS